MEPEKPMPKFENMLRLARTHGLWGGSAYTIVTMPLVFVAIAAVWLVHVMLAFGISLVLQCTWVLLKFIARQVWMRVRLNRAPGQEVEVA